MAVSSKPPANAFVAAMRRVYNPVGFSKGYNFVLWFIFAGAMMGFSLARLIYLDFDGKYCGDTKASNGASPGECWRYNTKDVYKVGIRMHLFTIIPASFLVCFQFVPAIRHKVMLFHRLNGYAILLLSLPGTAGAVMIARVAFGGGIDIQVIVGLLAIMFAGSLGISYYNVKRLQLEQHRAWMLRAWFYGASIITCRLIMVLSIMISSNPGMGPYYKAKQCAEIATMYNTTALLVDAYPDCKSIDAWTLVKADINLDGNEHMAAALNLSFGMALWLGLALHAIGIEVYLHLTPAEAERLRNVSYQRQLKAGFKNPGRGGLTADRIGDANLWVPAATRPVDDKDVQHSETGGYSSVNQS